MRNKYLVLALSTVLVSACSDDSDSSNNASTGTEQTGVFVDSPVANIGYKTDSRDSVTNTDGEFIYLPGEEITFYIGEITFPPVTASATVTPLDMSPSDSIDDLTTNVLRLLQTLDTDGDPSNGIHISEGTKSGAVNNVDFDQTISSFNSDSDVLSAVRGATLDSPLMQLVPADDAVDHFESTLEDLDISIGDDVTIDSYAVGTWKVDGALFSFFENGKYVVVEEFELEYGNYFNDKTSCSIYTESVLFDENEDTGLNQFVSDAKEAVRQEGGDFYQGCVFFTNNNQTMRLERTIYSDDDALNGFVDDVVLNKEMNVGAHGTFTNSNMALILHSGSAGTIKYALAYYGGEDAGKGAETGLLTRQGEESVNLIQGGSVTLADVYYVSVDVGGASDSMTYDLARADKFSMVVDGDTLTITTIDQQNTGSGVEDVVETFTLTRE